MNDPIFLFCAVALPLVAGLHRLSVQYGYRGLSWKDACRDARMAAVGTAIFISAPLMLLR
jgi:hypothetical protein